MGVGAEERAAVPGEDTVKLRPYSYEGKLHGYHFWCPGCDQPHGFSVAGDCRWQFDGNMDRPTVAPSILVQGGHYAEGHSGECWCTYNAKHPDNPSGFKCLRCHSYIRSGRIQFLNDCSHSLAGQTVELPDWPDDL